MRYGSPRTRKKINNEARPDQENHDIILLFLEKISFLELETEIRIPRNARTAQ